MLAIVGSFYNLLCSSLLTTSVAIFFANLFTFKNVTYKL